MPDNDYEEIEEKYMNIQKLEVEEDQQQKKRDGYN